MLKSMETLLKIVTHQQSWWFCICGQSPMILATPQGVGTVWHSQKAYTHRKAANGQSFYFNWGAHDLSLVFTCLLIQAFPKTIFYKSVSRILFICRFCFFYWTLKLFWTPRLYRGGRETRKPEPVEYRLRWRYQIRAGNLRSWSDSLWILFQNHSATADLKYFRPQKALSLRRLSPP